MDIMPPFPTGEPIIHASPHQCMSSPVMHNHRSKFTLEVPNCVSMCESDCFSSHKINEGCAK